MHKFNVNEVVLYQNGDRFELGIVKEVIREAKHYWNGVLNQYEIHRFEYNECEDKLYLYTHDDKVIVTLALSCNASVLTDEEILEFLIEVFEEYEYVETISYRVWYHTGDTTALTPEHCLHKISNAYAFTILRKQADPYLKPRTCREMAVKILEPFMFHGKAYYQLEDWLTCLLERKSVEFPYDIVADEYFRCVVRDAIMSRIDLDVYYSDETIEELVNKIIVYIYDKNFIELIDDFIKEEK